MRTTRDPIEHVKMLLTEHGFATKEELKATEKEARTALPHLLCAWVSSAPLKDSGSCNGGRVNGGFQTARSS